MGKGGDRKSYKISLIKKEKKKEKKIFLNTILEVNFTSMLLALLSQNRTEAAITSDLDAFPFGMNAGSYFGQVQNVDLDHLVVRPQQQVGGFTG